MFAIVNFRGEQYRIDSDMKQLRVAYIADAKPGSAVSFDDIVLTQAAGGTVALGGKASISATVDSHGRDPKIIVFHKKRRKGYRKMNGHRQDFTTLNITGFSI
ncbi:MAG TPA: 50S ribosomal protein L21 [Candidatus Kapabacteria bacterium]|nr:50S ribosomal protein L21 [Candidatus Kapabacteria bacterium]